MGTLVLAKKKRHSGSISSSSVVDIDSDKQLVAKFKAGDLDAFKQLYERYHKRLISVAIGAVSYTHLRAHGDATLSRMPSSA